jgi:transposase
MDVINDDAKCGFRRIKILTGPTRRRRWSVAEKGRIVAETMAPGAAVTEVARRWQVCPQQVWGWRREARTGDLVLPSEALAHLIQGFGVDDAKNS